MLKKLALMCAYLSASCAHAASFDCAKAATWVEKSICASPTLSQLDDALAQNYSGSYTSNIGKAARRELVKSQGQWLKTRDQCKTVACIEKLYRQRVDQLCEEYGVVSGVNWGCVVNADSIP